MTKHERGLSPLGLETKFVPVEAFSDTGTGGTISGYASIFGQADQGGDIVLPGAFHRSLEMLKRAGRRVKFLWQHDPARPIGVWENIQEDAVGLQVTGEILGAIAQGAEALALLRAGAIDGLSIGYRTVRATENRETGGRNLVELDLWEVSLVTFPMLPTARASLAPPKPADEMVLALAEALRGGGRSSGDDPARV